MRAFADRLLGSNEVFATFGLGNSLAGFLVGPLVLALAMMIRNLADEECPWLRAGARSVWLPLPCSDSRLPDLDQEPQFLDRAPCRRGRP